MNWVNLTPHKVDVVRADGTVISFNATGVVARVVSQDTIVGTIDKIQITDQVSKIINLPPPIKGTCFIVSRIVAREAPERTDLFIPGPPIKHPATGQIRGCNGLSRVT